LIRSDLHWPDAVAYVDDGDADGGVSDNPYTTEDVVNYCCRV